MAKVMYAAGCGPSGVCSSRNGVVILGEGEVRRWMRSLRRRLIPKRGCYSWLLFLAKVMYGHHL